MDVAEFDSRYFYATQLRALARQLGVPVGNRRKTDLEQAIRTFLTTGEATRAPHRARRSRDELAPDARVVDYVDDRATKDFLVAIVRAAAPDLPAKSGQWYWLNDWRRSQQRAFTYRDLAAHLGELMQTDGRLPQIPSARMNNFITDFRADPVNSAVPHAAVMDAWTWLKRQPGPHTYATYRRLRPS